MNLRDDWATRLWRNKLWFIRMLIAAALMLPFWIIEKVIEVQNDASDWLYWKWRNAGWIEWMTVTLAAWVGKIGENEPKERKVDE